MCIITNNTVQRLGEHLLHVEKGFFSHFWNASHVCGPAHLPSTRKNKEEGGGGIKKGVVFSMRSTGRRRSREEEEEESQLCDRVQPRGERQMGVSSASRAGIGGKGFGLVRWYRLAGSPY